MTSELTSLDKQGGVELKGDSDLETILQTAGFNFEVEKAACYDPEGSEIDNLYLLRRADTKHVLNTVRGRYTAVSNREMFEPFHEAVANTGAIYESAGSTNNGGTCWITARLPEDIVVGKDDKVQQRIVAMANHDGVRGNSYFQYTNRVVCNNMLQNMTKESRKQGHRVRHTTNWETQLQAAYEGFSKAIAEAGRFHKVANELNDQGLSKNQAELFLQALLPIAPEATDRSITRVNNKRGTLLELFENGAGNAGKTRWDMLNAVTEYFDHHALNARAGRARAFVRNAQGMHDKKRLAYDLLVHTEKFAKIDPINN